MISLRLATWNLNRCSPHSARAARILEAMKEINADVWVLTETFRDLSPGESYKLSSISHNAPDRDYSTGECWVAIWSRLPSYPITLKEDIERVAGAVISDCVVVGTVLPWLTDNRDAVLRGYHAFAARLEEQSTDWSYQIATHRSLCVAGDFNQDLLNEGHYYQSKAARDVLRKTLAIHSLRCLTGGQNDPLALHSDLASIDHICVTNIRTLNSPPSSVWPEPGSLTPMYSDHYCMYADIEPV